MHARLVSELRRLTPVHRFLLTGDALLYVVFLLGFILTWRMFPAEGVKLHGNIDTGVDLFGDRRELLWLTALATAVAFGNPLLALWARTRDRAAATFLIGSTLPLLAGFLGALVFLFKLNRG